ncbi:MAG: hypothetical protein N2C14_07680, partial [Planctomycetales bacterium]
MSNETGAVRRVVWLEAFPFLPVLLRVFSLAIEIRKLLLASLAMLLTASGWIVASWLFFPIPASQPEWTESYRHWPWEQASQPYQSWPWSETVSTEPPTGDSRSLFKTGPVRDPLLGVWRQLSDPFLRVFSTEHHGIRLAFCATCGL